MADSTQVNVRYSNLLLARIDSAAGEGKRSEWILEACRMRLDGGVKLVAAEKSSDVVGSSPPAPTKLTQQLEASLAATPEPSARLDSIDISGWATEKQAVDHEKKVQALREICAGRVVLAKDGRNDGFIAESLVEEVPICGKTWWEDGEQWECLMDAGHREALANKHGLRGIVRRLDV